MTKGEDKKVREEYEEFSKTVCEMYEKIRPTLTKAEIEEVEGKQEEE